MVTSHFNNGQENSYVYLLRYRNRSRSQGKLRLDTGFKMHLHSLAPNITYHIVISPESSPILCLYIRHGTPDFSALAADVSAFLSSHFFPCWL